MVTKLRSTYKAEVSCPVTISFGQAIGWYVHNLLFLECLWHTVCFYFSCSLYIFYLFVESFPNKLSPVGDTIIEKVVKYSSDCIKDLKK